MRYRVGRNGLEITTAHQIIQTLGRLVLVVGIGINGIAKHVQIFGHYAYVCCDAGLVVIDLIILNVTLRRALNNKFGADKVDRVGLYAATRSIQLRPMRLPKPQVKRGDRPR